jgi:hypothetical protein
VFGEDGGVVGDACADFRISKMYRIEGGKVNVL